MDKLRKLGLVLLSLIGISVIVSVLLAYGSALRSAEKAELALEDIQTLRLNADWAEARRFIDLHAASSSARETTCIPGEVCKFTVRWDNRWLAKLQLAPMTDCGVQFTLEYGRVTRINAAIVLHKNVIGSSRNMYSAEVLEEPFSEALGGRTLSAHSQS